MAAVGVPADRHPHHFATVAAAMERRGEEQAKRQVWMVGVVGVRARQPSGHAPIYLHDQAGRVANQLGAHASFIMWAPPAAHLRLVEDAQQRICIVGARGLNEMRRVSSGSGAGLPSSRWLASVTCARVSPEPRAFRAAANAPALGLGDRMRTPRHTARGAVGGDRARAGPHAARGRRARAPSADDRGGELLRLSRGPAERGQARRGRPPRCRRRRRPRHADVGQDHVGALGLDGAEQRLEVGARRHDLEVVLRLEEPADAFANEVVVLREHDPDHR
jgi:hypothetical protein